MEHGGAYTLLGSKPATVEDLVDMSPENSQQLQEYLAAHPDLSTIEIERYLEEGWDLLKQKPLTLSKRFILTEVNCESYSLLVFLNTELTLQAMKNHYHEFAFAGDFDPVREIEHLRTGKHEFWKRVFNDFICQGILLGYGIENGRIFEQLFKERASGTLQEEYLASENNDPRVRAEYYLNNVPFRLPIFVMFDRNESEQLVSKYKNERDEIRKFYAHKNFLDETLAILEK